MIILGIDPGTATTGYGVISAGNREYSGRSKKQKPRVVDFGCIITVPSCPAEKRLEIIYNDIVKLIKKHKPGIISVESLYFFKNLKTALPVSQARGVILLAAAKNNVIVREFTPLQVKMTVVGYGRAEKRQMQEMISRLLDIDGLNPKKNGRKKDDASDALGVALCAFLDAFNNLAPRNTKHLSATR